MPTLAEILAAEGKRIRESLPPAQTNEARGLATQQLVDTVRASANAGAGSTSIEGRWGPMAPSASAPGGTLYNPPTSGLAPGSRAAQRQATLEQGEERLVLAQESAASQQANDDRNYRAKVNKDFADQAITANKLRRESDIDTQGAEFLIAERNLDPGSDAYPAQVAALLKPRAYALQHPEVQKTLGRNDAIRAKHLEIVGKGGASEFSGPAASAFDREITASGSVEKARAHALSFQKGEDEVRKLVAEGHITPEDLNWGTGADNETKNKHFITDQSSPHYGEVDHSKLLMTGNARKGAATKAQAAATTQAADLKTAYGITREQLMNPLEAPAYGKLEEGVFTNQYTGAEKGDVVQLQVGKDKPVVMPRAAYKKHLAAAALDDANASEAEKAQAKKILGK